MFPEANGGADGFVRADAPRSCWRDHLEQITFHVVSIKDANFGPEATPTAFPATSQRTNVPLVNARASGKPFLAEINQNPESGHGSTCGPHVPTMLRSGETLNLHGKRCVTTAWWVCGGCLVGMWWVRGGCLVGVWWAFGGFVVRVS